MKRKAQIYLDTSVPNAFMDESKPERQEETNLFWKKIGRYQVFISDLVEDEIKATADLKRKRELLRLVKNFKVLSSKNEKVLELAEAYIDAGIVPEEYRNDALHLAIASVYGVEIFVSWNYRHIVKVSTKRLVNSINALMGLRFLEIVTPSML